MVVGETWDSCLVADCWAARQVWLITDMLLSISVDNLVDAETVRGCDSVVLGTCVGVISIGGCDDGELNFELAGDRPIVR